MLWTNFESIFKPVEQYRGKINQMKSGWKGKTPYTEKINTYVPSRWCINSAFADGDAIDSVKLHRGKDSIEKFVEAIEDEVRPLYAKLS